MPKKKTTRKRPPGKSSIDGNSNGGNRRSDPNLRPTKYTDALAQLVLSEMREGKSLIQIMAQHKKAPHRQTVHDWTEGRYGAPEDFRHNYARSIHARAAYYADRVLQVADSVDESRRREAKIAYDEAIEAGEPEEIVEALASAAERRSVDASRIQIDALKWTAGKLHSTKWGKSIAITGGGEDAPPVRVDLKGLSTEDLEALAKMEKRLSKEGD